MGSAKKAQQSNTLSTRATLLVSQKSIAPGLLLGPIDDYSAPVFRSWFVSEKPDRTVVEDINHFVKTFSCFFFVSSTKLVCLYKLRTYIYSHGSGTNNSEQQHSIELNPLLLKLSCTAQICGTSRLGDPKVIYYHSSTCTHQFSYNNSCTS